MGAHCYNRLQAAQRLGSLLGSWAEASAAVRRLQRVRPCVLALFPNYSWVQVRVSSYNTKRVSAW